MSYCRWSSDDFGCDLYCYQDVAGGWTTHVAGNKPVGEVPRMPPFPMAEATEAERDEWMAAREARHTFLENCERASLGLPYDGETFNDPTLESFRARLVMLREAGYRFPDDVFDAVDEEMRAEATP